MKIKLTPELIHGFMRMHYPNAYFQECSGAWVIPGAVRLMFDHEIKAAAQYEAEQYEQGLIDQPGWYPKPSR